MKRFTVIIAILLFFVSLLIGQYREDVKQHPFKKEIENFIKWDKKNSPPKNALLFVGSSSIRLWNTAEEFPEFTVINRGFGGSHISHILLYINETTLKYEPRIIVFYAGDNDIAAGKTAKQVLKDFKLFVKKTTDTKIIYLPIKPSIARWYLWPEMNKTNNLIQEYCKKSDNLFYLDLVTPMLDKNKKPNKDLFIKDGLHLNKKGYKVWDKHLLPLLIKVDMIKH